MSYESWVGRPILFILRRIRSVGTDGRQISHMFAWSRLIASLTSPHVKPGAPAQWAYTQFTRAMDSRWSLPCAQTQQRPSIICTWGNNTPPSGPSPTAGRSRDAQCWSSIDCRGRPAGLRSITCTTTTSRKKLKVYRVIYFFTGEFSYHVSMLFLLSVP